MKKLCLWMLFSSTILSTGQAQELTCLGEKKELVIAALMPYFKAKVNNIEGMFVIDYGTSILTLDSNGFIGNTKPKPIQGTTNIFASFDFFYENTNVLFNLNNHSGITGLGTMKQAGLIGTSFLNLKIITLDYEHSLIYNQYNGSLCPDGDLIQAGYKAASTVGYFSNNYSNLKPGFNMNVPTVPVKIGAATAIAQIDPGFSDSKYKHSVNINKAFFDAITAAGIHLIPFPQANLQLGTCVTNVSENVSAYKLPANVNFEITGTDGNAVLVSSDATIFYKQSPPEAWSCGGIGTWAAAAAQFGGSFLVDSKRLIFDPYTSRVWFYTR